jgi:hypothetical protein
MEGYFIASRRTVLTFRKVAACPNTRSSVAPEMIDSIEGVAQSQYSSHP